MWSEHINKTLKIEEQLRQQAPFLRAIEDLNRRQEFVRAAFGSLEDIRRTASLIQTSQLGEKLTQMQDRLTLIEKQFRLPEIAESAKLLHEFANSMAERAAHMERYWNHNSELQSVIESAIAILNELRALFDFSMLSCVWYGPPFLGAYLCLRILLLRRLSPAIPMHGN